MGLLKQIEASIANAAKRKRPASWGPAAGVGPHQAAKRGKGGGFSSSTVAGTNSAGSVNNGRGGGGRGGRGRGGRGRGGRGRGGRGGRGVRGVCRAYQNGCCRFGDACKFSHEGVSPSVVDLGALEPPYEVYLKYLPPRCTAGEVHALFAPCGQIQGDVRLMHDHATGNVIRGFVTFETEEGMRAALKMDLSKFQSRNISVTPATTTGTMQAEGTHTPALLAEVLKRVVHNPNGVYVDGTFGRGGHSRAILEALGPDGRLHAFDVDDEAIKVGRELEKKDPRFRMHHRWFGDMAAELGPLGIEPAGVLLDIGISSPQLDGGRGFRPEMDGPLDLRFDASQGQSAWDFLNSCRREELVRILVEYGGENERAARRIADCVILARQGLVLGGLPKRTREFARLVVMAKGKEYQQMHPAKMTFQALRIHINREFDELKRGMASALAVMRPGGKLGIITWKHSECAIVVDYFRAAEVARQDYPLLCWYQDARTASNKGDLSLLPDAARPDSGAADAGAADAGAADAGAADAGAADAGAAESATGAGESSRTPPVATPTGRLGSGGRGGAPVMTKLPRDWGFTMEDPSRPTADELKLNSRSRSAVLHVLRKERGVRCQDLERAAYPLFGWGAPPGLPPPVKPPATLQEGLPGIKAYREAMLKHVAYEAAAGGCGAQTAKKRAKTKAKTRNAESTGPSNWEKMQQAGGTAPGPRKKKRRKVSRKQQNKMRARAAKAASARAGSAGPPASASTDSVA